MGYSEAAWERAMKIQEVILRKACFGEMLHIDGSKHAWLAGAVSRREADRDLGRGRRDLTALLHAQLWPAESTQAVLVADRDVVDTHGIPASIYTDRAGWAFETPTAGAAVSKTHLTQVGQVPKRLGVEHIPSNSSQARGRSERMNGTLQNQAFSIPPRETDSAFVPAGDAPLDEIFCRETVRQVGKDNAINCGKVVLQISKQPGRKTCAGLAVVVKQHFDGRGRSTGGRSSWGATDWTAGLWKLPVRPHPQRISNESGQITCQ